MYFSILISLYNETLFREFDENVIHENCPIMYIHPKEYLQTYQYTILENINFRDLKYLLQATKSNIDNPSKKFIFINRCSNSE